MDKKSETDDNLNPQENLMKIQYDYSLNNSDNCATYNHQSKWAWIVVLASFLCNAIVDGIIFSFGVLLLEISTTFNETKYKISWIGSLQAGFYLIIGPLVSFLCNRYGCRIITIVGSLIASIGLIASSFATSIFWLYLTFGLITGIGFGFIYLPAIVTVASFYEKKRALATGISVCGSGIGTFVMVPIVQYLDDTFGWRGCMLVLGGFVLNCIVLGMLFRLPPLPLSSKMPSSPRLDESIESENNNSNFASFSSYKQYNPSNYHNIMYNTSTISLEDIAALESSSLSSKKRSVEYIKNNKDHQLYRDSSIHSLSSSEKFWSIFQEMDVTLLASPSFIILCFSGFLTLAGFFTPFMYIIDKAVQMGISQEDGAYLLSVIGITNTLGRIFCGYISDSSYVDALILNNLSLTIGGLSTILLPILCNTHISFIIYGSIFGFAIACFVALRSVITIELLGLEKLTNAFGLLLLPQGIATMIGAPITGWFYDITGTYNSSFYIAGSLILVSGLICFPLRIISKWESTVKQKKKICQ